MRHACCGQGIWSCLHLLWWVVAKDEQCDRHRGDAADDTRGKPRAAAERVRDGTDEHRPDWCGADERGGPQSGNATAHHRGAASWMVLLPAVRNVMLAAPTSTAAATATCSVVLTVSSVIAMPYPAATHTSLASPVSGRCVRSSPAATAPAPNAVVSQLYPVTPACRVCSAKTGRLVSNS